MIQMNEYISRADYCEENCGKENREGYKECKNCGMLNVPTADVQPVVRCKDCIYLNRHDCPMAYIEHQTLQFAAVTPDFFCAKGADHEP